MASTHTELYFHAMFAVKDRKKLIRKNMRVALFAYIQSIFKMEGQHLIAINGTSNHVHLLFRISSSKSIADLMRDVKALSSRYVNQQELSSKPFYWEHGYAAFTCSYTQVPRIRQMIERQDIYHEHKTFQDEYLEILGELNIDFSRTARLNWFDALKT